MSENTRTCPHCGKALESEVPEGWIKVPLETWNRLVKQAEIRPTGEQEVGKMSFAAVRLVAIGEDIQRLGHDAHYWIGQIQKGLGLNHAASPRTAGGTPALPVGEPCK